MATVEIYSIVIKYKTVVQDIELNIVAETRCRRGTKRRAALTKSRDKRSTVHAKYNDPNSVATWTGLGRTPAWVQGICPNEVINVEGFKKDG